MCTKQQINLLDGGLTGIDDFHHFGRFIFRLELGGIIVTPWLKKNTSLLELM